MDSGDIGQKFLPMVLLIIFPLLGIFIRKRKWERTQLGVVVSLWTELNYNQKLVEVFAFQWQVKRFKTGSWNRNKTRLDFLGQELQSALSDAFNIARDFNLRIDEAKKHKLASYLASIEVERLKEPLAKSKQGLEKWFREKFEQARTAPRERVLSGQKTFLG